MARLPEDLQNAELFRRLLIEPMLHGMQEKLDAHHKEITANISTLSSNITDHAGRIQRLESGQRKALVGWSLYASAVAAAVGAGYGWLKSHFRIT